MSVAEYLVAQRSLEAAASRGPWIVQESTTPARDYASNQALQVRSKSGGVVIGQVNEPSDARFIESARTELPRMVAALEAMAAELSVHREYVMKNAAKFGRSAPDCSCEQCRAWDAMERELGGVRNG